MLQFDAKRHSVTLWQALVVLSSSSTTAAALLARLPALLLRANIGGWLVDAAASSATIAVANIQAATAAEAAQAQVCARVVCDYTVMLTSGCQQVMQQGAMYMLP